MPEIQPGEQIILEVEDLSHRGEGVGRWQGRVVFVPLAVPGDRVRATVVEVKKKYLQARLEEVLVPGPARCRPRCPSFARCGGCHVQHLPYDCQLQYKTKLVRDSLERIGKLTGVKVLPILGMDNPWHYRNKVRFHVVHREGRLVLGLYASGSHALGHWIARDALCHILDGELNNLALIIENLLNKYREGLLDGSKSLLSHVTLRKALMTGETMVVLAAFKDHWPRQEELAGELAGTGRVTTVVQQRAVLPDREVDTGRTRTLYGRGHITDYLGGLVFRLSATSFYQVNPVQTRVLYEKVTEYAGLTGMERVVDAYCGVGTIALFLARQAREVLGVELSPRAVADAQQNARLNNLNNVSFLRGAVERLLPRLFDRGSGPDVVVLDPPRRGCHRSVLETLARYPVPRVVYVSCDPGTLARDLGFLAGHGYRVVEVQPVDMFPQTHHVECCCLLTST
ncbi:23S rRNA (uracil(1939)-C(5))-methyltransferase RlmD [Desulfofundulus thermosubterraneus]|uniref:23S rRNA m(5)U-1939 methyltransferase n=1 Tax=Desulfofundulus thermosubterraneus DSM 16057 TaxID=1121432 RepID=A0A1M6GQE6_9FIRM|nr:23S rRNA (uracil(1939)-C(5))-methyltransferase RlmD [Desulfofundulus thermosubterraneus]SHJ12118.1 23S rRNA m(5)U-1939 methyltransferase [Desulfofundulus thermosubterraneus DSM 16057]